MHLNCLYRSYSLEGLSDWFLITLVLVISIHCNAHLITRHPRHKYVFNVTIILINILVGFLMFIYLFKCFLINSVARLIEPWFNWEHCLLNKHTYYGKHRTSFFIQGICTIYAVRVYCPVCIELYMYTLVMLLQKLRRNTCALGMHRYFQCVNYTWIYD